MSSASNKRGRTDELVEEGTDKIESVQQFYAHVTSGGLGPQFVKQGEMDFLDPSQRHFWAVISRSTVIEKGEAVFGNVAPEHVTSVVRVQNKITALNVGGFSLPINRFTNVSAVMTAKRLGADYVLLCHDSFLAVPPFQIDGDSVHVGTATITFADKGDGLGELYTAMGKCISSLCNNLTAGQLKSLCEKGITVVNLAKTNMRFWSAELSAVLNANNMKELLTAVTMQRSAAKVSDTVIQFCALVVSVAHADRDPAQFLEVLAELDNTTMILPAITMYGKLPLPAMPKAKDKGTLFVDERGTELEVKKLIDVKDGEVILTNDASIVAEGQVLSLLSAATTVYVKPPGAIVFYKGKAKHAKYEKREWSSMRAKPILDLIQLLVVGGLKAPGTSMAKKTDTLMPADSVDDD